MPIAYGLHPNSEINFMTKQADDLCKAILELQPRGGGAASGLTLQEKVKRLLDDIVDKLPEQFSMLEIEDRITMEDRTPYTNVFLQEIDRMSKLLYEMRRSLVELDMGLRGDLSMSEMMETLMDSLFDDKVPARWDVLAWPSLRPLGSWLQNMLDRYKQLLEWTGDLNTPKVRASGGTAAPLGCCSFSLLRSARPLHVVEVGMPERRLCEGRVGTTGFASGEARALRTWLAHTLLLPATAALCASSVVHRSLGSQASSIRRRSSPQ